MDAEVRSGEQEVRRKSRGEIYSCCERGDEVIRCERRGCRGEGWLAVATAEGNKSKGQEEGWPFTFHQAGANQTVKGTQLKRFETFLDQFPILNHAIEISIGWIWKNTLIFRWQLPPDSFPMSPRWKLPFDHFLTTTLPQNCEQDQAPACPWISSTYESHKWLF